MEPTSMTSSDMKRKSKHGCNKDFYYGLVSFVGVCLLQILLQILNDWLL